MLKRRKIDTGQLPDVLRHKWPGGVLNEGFVPVPKRLLRCLPQIILGEGALEKLQVILAVVDYERPNLPRPPALAYLAFNAGLEPEEFRAKLKELGDEGLLEFSGPDDAMAIDYKGLITRIQQLTPEE